MRLIIIWLLSISACFAQIPSVVNITINGETHQVTELIRHRKGLINQYPESWTYKTLDSIYTITIYKKDYEANRALLKYVPDNRPFYIKHPVIHYAVCIFNTASMIMNILQLVRL
jgi:hypothetical protein